jgi:hypothetical protein
VIFVNGSMPRFVADELSRAGKDVKWKGELFPLDTKDPVWLEAVGVNGWLAITRDGKIRTRPAERQAITEHGVGCFILTYRNDLKRAEIAQLVLAHIEAMEEKFRRTERPFIYTVAGNGEFRRLVRPWLAAS